MNTIFTNIDEEMLGAYLEGTLSAEEASIVGDALDSDASLSDLMIDVQATDIDWNDSVYDDFPNFDSEFQLPVVDDVVETFDQPFDDDYVEPFNSDPEISTHPGNTSDHDENAYLTVDDPVQSDNGLNDDFQQFGSFEPSADNYSDPMNESGDDGVFDLGI